MTTVSTAPARTVRADEPWPGLESYTEDDAALFYGREAETEELFRLLRREVLTVVFGPSGTGKTSLLQAGLFPRLSEQHFFPVPVRLDYSSAAQPLVSQIRSAVDFALTRGQIEQESVREPDASHESLWEFFHRTVFWDRRNDAMTPVIVIDQFEEIFTLGKGHPGATGLLTQLADLVENYIPAEVRERLERAGSALPPVSEQHYKILIALREDFVSKLDGVRKMMPSVMHNRFALTRLNGRQALRPVLLPGAGLVSADVAEQIVRKVASADAQVPLEELSVDPALLSLMCRELNARRRRDNLDAIPADLVNNTASNILTDFYAAAFADLDPRAREFVEDRLLTSDGFRTTVARHAAAQQGLDEAMDRLVDRRVLRSEERLGLPHLELTHDVLTRVARASRDARLERQRLLEEEQRRAIEESARQAELARTRRTLTIVGIAGVLCLVLALVAFRSYRITKSLLATVESARTQVAAQREKAELAATEANAARDNAVSLAAEAKAQAEEAVRQKTNAEKARVDAETQRSLAVAKGNEALARQLLTQAQTAVRLRGALALGTLLTIESMRLYPSPEADQALRANLALLPRQVGQIQLDESETFQARISGNGNTLASVGDRAIQVWNLETRQRSGTIPTAEPATTLTLSHDGTRIAASVRYGKFGLGVFDASGKSLTPKPLPAANVLAWSPDNRYLAAAGDSPETIVWDTTTFTPVSLVHAGVAKSLSGGVRAVAFSADGTMVAAARRNIIGVWAVPSWRQIAEITHDGGVVFALTFSPSSQQIAAASNGQVQVWTIDGPKPTARFAVPSVEYFESMPLTFDPGGRFIAVAGGGGAAVWDLRETPVERLTFRHEARILTLAFSPDGSHVAAGGGAAASVYSVQAAREVGRMTEAGGVVGLGFVHDGRDLVTVGSDGSAHIWETAGISRRAVIPMDGGLQRASFTRRNEAILSGDRYNRSVRIVDLRTGRAIGDSYDAAVDLGNQLLVVQRTVSGLAVRDLRSGRDVAALQDPTLTAKTVQQGRVSSKVGLQWVKFSPDGRYLCAFGTESEPQLWDVRAAKRIALPKLAVTFARDRDRLDAAFTPDATRLAIRDGAESILVYSLPDAQFLARLNIGATDGDLQFSPDGRHLATTDGFRLWDARVPEKPLTALPADVNGRGTATFSPDGRFVAHFDKVWALPNKIALNMENTPEQVTFNATSTMLAALDGRTVTLWDIPGRRRLARLALTESGSAVAFSPDGRHIATTDSVNVRVWNVDGSEVVRIEHLAKVTGVAFSPNGDLLSFARVTAEGESAMHVLLWRPDQLITQACQQLPRNLDPGEWREYLGAEPYRKTCPNVR